MKKRIAITGGAGFLGKYLVNSLARNINYEIILLARIKNKYSESFKGLRNVIFHEGDLLNYDSIEGFLTKGTIVIHLAYLSGNAAGNIIATNNIIAASNSALISQFIHCSTAVVHGFSGEKLINEDSPTNPKGTYQENKAMIETLLDKNLLLSIPLKIVRPTEILGVGNKSIINKIIFRYQNPSIALRIYNFLLYNRRCNLVCVQNVVHAIEFLLNCSLSSSREVFIISDDHDNNNSYKNVSDIISRKFSQSIFSQGMKFGLPVYLLEILFVFLKNHSPPNRVYSSNRIIALGYKHQVSISYVLDEILSNTDLKEHNNENT